MERLVTTLVYALLVHGVVLLGFNFDWDSSDRNRYEPGMEITLVNPRRQAVTLEQADFLANANQQGGGNAERRELPTTRLQGTPDPVAATAKRDGAASPVRLSNQEVLATSRPKPDRTTIAPPEKKHLTRPEKLTSGSLLAQAREFARLEAQLAVQQNAYAKLPKKKFLSAQTREYKYAAYLEHWRARVEKIGNLNYPLAASQQGITGSLRLSVELNRDGTVRDIRLRRSSGYPILDQAAMHIINLAAPFAPFPDNIKEEADVLVITRTWQFLPGNRLTSN